ncbi:MAG: TIR domain-containing protein [Desulfuromonadaceae bacterium]|nr:TIR domain-containing protein [Desulfuromonadaceae bacterium]
MKNSLTVFLCSTYADLTDERLKILSAIRKLQLQHDSMEFFGARANQAIETCLEEVRRSDLLVVIVGHRYGSLVPGREISFSEAEYEEGHRLGKPCLVYLRSDEVPVLPKFIERDPDNLRRLEHWKSILCERHTVAQFSDPNDLALQVSADISRTVQSIKEAQLEGKSATQPSLESMMAEVSEILMGALGQGIAEDKLLSAVRRTVTSLLTDVGGRPPTVFLSYSHEDKKIVTEVAEYLRAAGINVWLDLSEIRWGDSLRERIDRGLDSADFLAFFMSSSSLGKPWPRAELNAIISRQLQADRGAMVLPILLEDTEIPPILRDIRYIDLRDQDVKGRAQELIDAIRHHIGTRREGGV